MVWFGPVLVSYLSKLNKKIKYGVIWSGFGFIFVQTKQEN